MLAVSPAAAQQGGPRAVTVEMAEVTASELASSVRAVGTLEAEASATLRAEVPGQIIAVHFDEGQPLEKGAPLYSVEATVLEAEVNEARANAERSEAALKRADELFVNTLACGAGHGGTCRHTIRAHHFHAAVAGPLDEAVRVF